MKYNLLENHKVFARWLVEQYRLGIINESFNMEFYGQNYSIYSKGGRVEFENAPEASRYTLKALERENMLLMDVQQSFYFCGFLERFFLAVDTNFGELEVPALSSDKELGGIGLNTAQFSQILVKDFTIDELKTVCHNMNINYESLPGTETIEAKARELVLFSQRHGRLLELLIITAKSRPRTDWSSLY